MRVRPIFWLLLLITSMSVLTFAILYQKQLPLQLHITEKYLVSDDLASLEIRLTDSQGRPIDQAQLHPSAHMTNMEMSTYETFVHPRGNGNYTVQLDLYMEGPWAITIQARAPGFSPSAQIMFVDVT